MIGFRGATSVVGAAAVLACASGTPMPGSSPAPVATPAPAPLAPPSPARTPWSATQLMVVTTPAWDSTGGVLRRYARETSHDAWREVGGAVPVMVGRAGLGWGMRDAADASAPVKREGDGRAPAGFFPVDTAFGFAPADSARWMRLPYAPLLEGSECVDDGSSVHYNTVVDRNAVQRVDWTSAEHMRRIDQYKLGAIVSYNAMPPVAGRGSCIFLHIWAGPGMPTTGCTSMAERDLTALLLWLDAARLPVLVQLPEHEYAARRASWRLP